MDKCCGTCKFYQPADYLCTWTLYFPISDAWSDSVQGDLLPEDGKQCPTYERKEA